MGNTGNGFDKDHNRAVEAGKTSKRGKSIKTILGEILNRPIEELEQYLDQEKMPRVFEGMTAEQAMWLKAAVQAIEGDKDARRDIADRIEGKAVQKQEISGADGEAIKTETVINITPVKADKE